MPQKSSTLICQLATVHNCDWLTKDKQIYKPSSIIFMRIIALAPEDSGLPSFVLCWPFLSRKSWKILLQTLTWILWILPFFCGPVIIKNFCIFNFGITDQEFLSPLNFDLYFVRFPVVFLNKSNTLNYHRMGKPEKERKK